LANIQEVKAGLSVSVEQAAKVTARIQRAIEETERMLVVLRSVSSGAGHPLVQAAITRCEQGKQRLTGGIGVPRASGLTHRDDVRVAVESLLLRRTAASGSYATGQPPCLSYVYVDGSRPLTN
jgi:hypothetical protein